MSIAKSLSDQLQSKTDDFAFATGFASSTTATLRDFRSYGTWNHTYKYICDVAALNNIEETMVLDSQRRMQQPRNLQYSITFKSTGYRESLSCTFNFKFLTIFFLS